MLRPRPLSRWFDGVCVCVAACAPNTDIVVGGRGARASVSREGMPVTGSAIKVHTVRHVLVC